MAAQKRSERIIRVKSIFSFILKDDYTDDLITQILNVDLKIVHCRLFKTSYSLSERQNLYSPHK